MTAARLHVVGQEFPDPPYPADTKTRGWHFPVDHERLEQSDTWALTPNEIRPWLLMLWLRAWQQTPMGSLPGDDIVIAARIGMPSAMFATHRPLLMRGWEKCADGRFYHNVITILVREKIVIRQTEHDRKAAYRDRIRLSHGTPQGQPRDGRGKDDAEAEAEAEAKSKIKSIVGLAPDGAKESAKKSEERQAATRVLDCLNRNAGRRYRPVPANLDMIVARMHEGYSEQDLKAITAVIARKWRGDEKMDQFIRPKTLFGRTNCAQYHGQLPASQIDA